jgi:RNA polymerase-binding transcription factor DksA
MSEATVLTPATPSPSAPSPLTPLERLDLRDSLQDRWRDVVMQITELSVLLHTALDGTDDTGDADEAIDAVEIATALSTTRLRLVEIEQAMQRLDDRTYGRCAACLMPIAMTTLFGRPESRYCDECRAKARP